MSEYLIYGANGYTGDLIARVAHQRGHRPILAGRNGQAVTTLANSLGLPSRVFGLAEGLVENLHGVKAVLHCAGPFAHTAAPMAEACLRRGVHYLDVTGEIRVIEMLASRNDEAKRAGVLLLPGVGFDVVPTDCLAVHLLGRLPTATMLKMGFQVRGRLSRGTSNTMIENLGHGGAVRKNGTIRRVAPCWKTRSINFGNGPTTAMTIPWGDVSTAWYSTRIPDIEFYAAAPLGTRLLARLSHGFESVLSWGLVQRYLKVKVAAGPAGPSEVQRRRGQTLVWGEVRDNRGCSATSWLRGPEGYTTTALTAVAAVERVLAGDLHVGFQTPGKLFGADFALTAAGYERFDG